MGRNNTRSLGSNSAVRNVAAWSSFGSVRVAIRASSYFESCSAAAVVMVSVLLCVILHFGLAFLAPPAPVYLFGSQPSARAALGDLCHDIANR